MQISHLLVLFACLAQLPGYGHEGHDEAVKKTISQGSERKVEVVSDKYEYVLKFEPAQVGDQVYYRLYINNYITNLPVQAGSLKLTWGKQLIVPTVAQPGVYLFDHAAEAPLATLKVQLNGAAGPDLVALTGIDAIADEDMTTAATSLLAGKNMLWLLLAGLLGALVMFLLMRLRRPGLAATVLVGGLLLPVSHAYRATAQDGQSKTGVPKAITSSNGQVLIAKEAQFLFGMETERVLPGSFAPSVAVFGTIIPAPQGQAVVTSPFTGTIRSLAASVGASVKRGQLLATLEQVVDAQAQTALTAESNNAEADLVAAKADYDRLQTVADIASKRDLAEARARYDKARRNALVYAATLSPGRGGARTMELRSPIDGVVQNFNYAIGATLEAGATAFTVTNLSRVFAEAQVFDKDLPLFARADSFSAASADPARRQIKAQVRLVSLGQSLNATNQSQRVLFEVVNAGQIFKLGEFVDIRAYARPASGTISIPTSAITEIDGKPALFVKVSPEEFRLAYIQPGQANDERTVVLTGLRGGERILITSAYQAKMIYGQ